MTQEEVVLQYMKDNGYITSIQAFGEGITRLSARVFTLRKKGYNIKSEPGYCRTRYGRVATYTKYFLADEETIDKHD